MSQQALDLRRSLQIVRRHKRLVGIAVALGLLGGGAYAVLKPPVFTSTAQVLLSESGEAAQSGAAASVNGGVDPYTATQEVIAKSYPVLVAALPHVRPAMSITQLSSEIKVGSQTSYIISISAEAGDASDAAVNANAVAASYISYIGSPSDPIGEVQAQVLQSATSDAGSSLKRFTGYAIYALLGGLAGAVGGAVIALGTNRSDPRLRQRDEIASSIGVPVLASFPVGHPSKPGEWTRLLENYKPGALHSLQLRNALQQLEIAVGGASLGRENGRWSLTVVSLSSDPGALALGPQLAIFAASQGIPTALVIGPQQDPAVAASLRRACAAPPASPRWPAHLRVLVTDDSVEESSDAELTVVVAVVDTRSPQVPGTIRTTATLLGVSAGAATAEQLARVVVSAVSHGHEITGILVADPDSVDVTTGRLPALGRRGQHGMPTRMTGIVTEIRR